MPALRPNGLRVKGSDGSVATTTITAPTGLVRGDYFLLIGASDTDTAQAGFVGPADADGFSPVLPWGGTLGGANVKVWAKWATGADLGKTYTITVPTGSAQVLYLAAFSAVDPVNPIAFAPVHGDGGSTAANAAVAPAVTSPVANGLALFAWWAKGGTTTQAFSLPAGTTTLDSSNSTGTGYVKAALGSEVVGTTSSGTRTATLSGTARRWSAVSLVLRPATTPTAPTGADALQRRELAVLRA